VRRSQSGRLEVQVSSFRRGGVAGERTTRAPQIFEEGLLLALSGAWMRCKLRRRVQSFGPLHSRYAADCRADGQGCCESGLSCFGELACFLTPGDGGRLMCPLSGRPRVPGMQRPVRGLCASFSLLRVQEKSKQTGPMNLAREW
jgi:hypothetical protein